MSSTSSGTEPAEYFTADETKHLCDYVAQLVARTPREEIFLFDVAVSLAKQASEGHDAALSRKQWRWLQAIHLRNA